MTEERKYAILFAATLMCARKLMEIRGEAEPVRMSTVDKAIRNAAYCGQMKRPSLNCYQPQSGVD
jgi:hypothetical protein